MKFIFCLVFSLFLLLPSTSFALFDLCSGASNTAVFYRNSLQGDTNFVLYVNPVQFTDGSNLYNAIIAAKDKLNSGVHSRNYTIFKANSGWASNSNSYNEYNDWSEGYLVTGTQFPMRAPWRIETSNCNQHTADLQINQDVNWSNSSTSTDLYPYGGVSRPYQTTFLHEMGHQLGLRHENTKYNLMGSDYTYIHRTANTATAYIGSDASMLLSNVYGLKSQNDFSVSHWKYGGADGQYSIHTRSGITKPLGQNYSMLTDTQSEQGETIWWGFKRGNSIGYEVTLENSGYQNWTLRVGYYLSTDKTFSSNDIYLGDQYITVNRGNPIEHNVTLQMPTNVSAGHYSIIAKIDDDNYISEVNESNNTTYTRIYLQ